jgi:hypothetical protein
MREKKVMNEIKTYLLEYTGGKLDHRINLGDEIQSIAAKRILKYIDGYVSREGLNNITEPCIVSLNGFFLDSSNWPPSKSVIPIPFAFHVSKKYEKLICSAQGIKYLKKYEPIGCRDLQSSNILKKHGVDSFYSKCLTLTLEKRKIEPNAGKVYIVGVTDNLQRIIPNHIKSKAIYVNQSKIELPNIKQSTRRLIAEDLLTEYKSNASLIITSRIHCAMPCIAMGIPVIFLYSASKRNDYRVHIIKDLVGINYVNEILIKIPFVKSIYSKKINWTPNSVDLETLKVEIKGKYKAAYLKAINQFNELFSQPQRRQMLAKRLKH